MTTSKKEMLIFSKTIQTKENKNATVDLQITGLFKPRLWIILVSSHQRGVCWAGLIDRLPGWAVLAVSIVSYQTLAKDRKFWGSALQL